VCYCLHANDPDELRPKVLQLFPTNGGNIGRMDTKIQCISGCPGCPFLFARSCSNKRSADKKNSSPCIKVILNVQKLTLNARPANPGVKVKSLSREDNVSAPGGIPRRNSWSSTCSKFPKDGVAFLRYTFWGHLSSSVMTFSS